LRYLKMRTKELSNNWEMCNWIKGWMNLNKRNSHLCTWISTRSSIRMSRELWILKSIKVVKTWQAIFKELCIPNILHRHRGIMLWHKGHPILEVMEEIQNQVCLELILQCLLPLNLRELRIQIHHK
jgi:hypothetical protein